MCLRHVNLYFNNYVVTARRKTDNKPVPLDCHPIPCFPFHFLKIFVDPKYPIPQWTLNSDSLVHPVFRGRQQYREVTTYPSWESDGPYCTKRTCQFNSSGRGGASKVQHEEPRFRCKNPSIHKVCELHKLAHEGEFPCAVCLSSTTFCRVQPIMSKFAEKEVRGFLVGMQSNPIENASFVTMYVKLNLSKKGNNSHLPRIKLKLACNCRGLHNSMRRLAVKVNVNKI